MHNVNPLLAKEVKAYSDERTEAMELIEWYILLLQRYEYGKSLCLKVSLGALIRYIKRYNSFCSFD